MSKSLKIISKLWLLDITITIKQKIKEKKHILQCACNKTASKGL